MSSPAREREKRLQRDAEYEERRLEQARKEALSMFGRIEEAEASEDVKDILHRIARHVGLED
jgi:hypothetical protein